MTSSLICTRKDDFKTILIAYIYICLISFDFVCGYENDVKNKSGELSNKIYTIMESENQFWDNKEKSLCNGEDCNAIIKDDIITKDKQAKEEFRDEPCMIQGNLRVHKNWYGYLAITNLSGITGKFYYKFIYPQYNCCVKIMLYLDEQVNQLRANMNCLQKQAVIDPRSQQVITLSPNSKISGCTSNHSKNGQMMIYCTSGRLLRSDSIKKWYIAASSCGSPTGLELEFTMWFYGLIGECPVSVLHQASPKSTFHIINVLFCSLLSAVHYYDSL